MPPTTPFKRLILRAVLRNVRPMVIPLVSVSDRTDLHGLHDVFHAILGWSGDLGYLVRSRPRVQQLPPQHTIEGASTFSAAPTGEVPVRSRRHGPMGMGRARLLSGRLRFRPTYPACRSFQHLA
jgi:hypothetical protein